MFYSDECSFRTKIKFCRRYELILHGIVQQFIKMKNVDVNLREKKAFLMYVQAHCSNIQRARNKRYYYYILQNEFVV